MTLKEKLIGEFEQLSEERKLEVIKFIKTKEQKNIENLMDTIIAENNEALKELAK